MRYSPIVTCLLFLTECLSKSMLHRSHNIKCPETSNQVAKLLPHPSNSHQYYQCFGSVPVLMECPDGQHFDPELKVCNYPVKEEIVRMDIQDGHCYADCIVPLNCTEVYCPPRVLMGSNILEDKDLTLEKCKDFCFGRNYKFAGVEEDNCYCGNEVWPLIEKPSSECDVRCSGDKSQVCGGKCRVNVYQNV